MVHGESIMKILSGLILNEVSYYILKNDYFRFQSYKKITHTLNDLVNLFMKDSKYG